MKTFKEWFNAEFPHGNLATPELEEAWEACAREYKEQFKHYKKVFDADLDQIERLIQQLKEANEVIAFYADKESWHGRLKNSLDCVPIQADDKYPSPEDPWEYGGKRAREYQNKFLTKENK